MEEELVGESSSPRKKMKIGAVQLVGVVLRRPPVVLQRDGWASMVGEMGELLHGLELEREGEGSECDEGDRARGALVEEGGVADAWGRGCDVAPRLCAHDTQRRCTSGPSVSVARTVLGWVTWQ